MGTLNKSDKNQAYWESKHPKTVQQYSGRPLPTGAACSMDVRNFLMYRDYELEIARVEHSLQKVTIEGTVQAVQKYVVQNLTYVSDETLGRPEYWLFPFETLALRKGDCEDGAILTASLLLYLLPESEHWRVRVTAGWVQSAPTAPQGGHAYVTFCRPKDNEWVVLDWCYYEDSSIPVNDKPLMKNNKPYKEVWFSFDKDSAYSHLHFNVSGRVKECDYAH